MSQAFTSPYHAVGQRMQFMAKAVLVAFLGGWLVCFLPWNDLLSRQGTPLGADFSMFYVAGQVAADGDMLRLYDQAEHQRRLHELFPGLASDFCLPYRYPPFVATICAPLARLPYGFAYAVFFSISVCAWLTTVRILMRELSTTRGASSRPLWWAVATCPIALETLIGGQASVFAVLIAVAVVALLRDAGVGHPRAEAGAERVAQYRVILAGALLALAAYKPNVLGFFAVGLVIRYPRLLVGAIPMGLMLIGLSMLVSGGSVLIDYLALTCRLTGGSWDVETPFWKVHGLAAWFELVLPGLGRMTAAATGLAASIAVGVWWRIRDKRQAPALDQAAMMLLVINSLCNLYTPIYDLLLLAPAVIYGLNVAGKNLPVKEADSRAGRFTALEIQLLFVVLYFGPHVSQALAKMVGLQCFPIILASVAVWFCYRIWSATDQRESSKPESDRFASLASQRLGE